ncbi:MAG: hypothetical protein R3E79_21000 [Caldilineaceae bacterium]
MGALLLQRLRPAIRPERPTLLQSDWAWPLLTMLLQELQAGKCVSLTGPGGVGKTSLGAAVTEQWPSPAVFWCTFRPTLNDQLDSLLFALGHFCMNKGPRPFGTSWSPMGGVSRIVS